MDLGGDDGVNTVDGVDGGDAGYAAAGAATLALLEADPSAPPAGVRETDLTVDQVRAALRLLYGRLTAKPEPGMSLAQIAAERFGVGAQFEADALLPAGRDGLATLYARKRLCMLRLQYHFVRLGLLDIECPEDDHVGEAYRKQFAHLHEALLRLHDCLMTNLMAHKCLDPQWAKDCPVTTDPFGIARFDMAKVEGPRQIFVVFVANQIQKLDLRRYKGELYRQKVLTLAGADGMPQEIRTHAWERYMDVKAFVNQVAPKETHFEMWQHSMTGSVMADTIRHFTEGFEHELPELVPDRKWHAFRNGLYYTGNAKFYAWGHPVITPDVTACKYHDHPFDESVTAVRTDQWYTVPTPKFQKVLHDQLGNIEFVKRDPKTNEPERHTEASAEMTNEKEALEARFDGRAQLPDVKAGDVWVVRSGHKVIRWAYILFGRLLFELNERDCWQVIPFLIGRAGTGKSLILSTICSWFLETDIGIVSNDQQKGFGLETIYNKFLWVSKEVKSDFQVDQAQFQSMITGEEMSIQRKFMTPLQVVWRAPGLLAGNELANWTDNSGSISRRLILFYFNKAIKKSDPMLLSDLKKEMAAILHKCCVAYLAAVKMFGRSDLWGQRPPEFTDPEDNFVLPKYFHDCKAALKRSTHVLEEFLNNKSQITVFGRSKRLGMPWETNGNDNGQPLSFKSLVNAYNKQQEVRGWYWKEDKYRTLFDDYELAVAELTDEDCAAGLNVYGGQAFPKGTKWIWGVRGTAVDADDAF